MKWGLKTLEWSPETIQTEGNLLLHSHTRDDQNPPCEEPNILRNLQKKENEKDVWGGIYYFCIWDVVQEIRSKTEHRLRRQWCICWHLAAQINATINTNRNESAISFHFGFCSKKNIYIEFSTSFSEIFQIKSLEVGASCLNILSCDRVIAELVKYFSESWQNVMRMYDSQLLPHQCEADCL